MCEVLGMIATSYWQLCPLLKGEDNLKLVPNELLLNDNLVKKIVVLEVFRHAGLNLAYIL